MSNNIEMWKPVVGYEGLYEVSNFGRVRSLKRTRKGKCESECGVKERILKQSEHTKGYLVCGLSKDGKLKYFKVHRLVAEAFIPNPDNKPCIDHINACKSDNRVDNIRWVSHKENSNNPLTREKFLSKIKHRNKKDRHLSVL